MSADLSNDDAESFEGNDDGFLDAVSAALTDALAMLREIAAEQGLDSDDLLDDEALSEAEAAEAAIDNVPITHLAGRYRTRPTRSPVSSLT